MNHTIIEDWSHNYIGAYYLLEYILNNGPIVSTEVLEEKQKEWVNEANLLGMYNLNKTSFFKSISSIEIAGDALLNLGFINKNNSPFSISLSRSGGILSNFIFDNPPEPQNALLYILYATHKCAYFVERPGHWSLSLFAGIIGKDIYVTSRYFNTLLNMKTTDRAFPLGLQNKTWPAITEKGNVEISKFEHNNQLKSELTLKSESILGQKHPSILRLIKNFWVDPVLSKVIAAIIIAISGLCWAWFYNKPYKNHEAELQVPPIVVEIRNSGKNVIPVGIRGDFFVWLPGPGARYTFGKYEFYSSKDTLLESDVFNVKPAERIRLLAHISNQELYGKILRQADCDIAFLVRKANGGHKTTENLPFTKEAIGKYYTTLDLGAE